MKTRTTGRQMAARAQAGLRKDLSVMYRQMVNEMAVVVARYAIGPEQTVPRNLHDDLAEDIGEIHRKYFVTSATYNTAKRKSFDENGLALTPYAKILQRWYVYAVVGAVKLDRAWMKRSIPKDVYAWLARTSRYTLSSEQAVQEAANPYLQRDDETNDEYRARLIKDLHIVHDNPLAEIDPSRRWVPFTEWEDSNGYRLSDRLWRGEARAREKIDAILMDALRNNTGALALSRLLEAYILPDRKGVKTTKPYGTRVSYDAMRLARTEIARAANQAAYISALINPYVNQIDVARSPNGDRTCPICPQHATIDVGGRRIRPPYDQNAAHVGPFHPHCVTPGQLVATMRGDIPIEEVQVGDYVLTHTGRYQRVLNAWSKHYTGNVHKIYTDEGCFELTSEHPVLLAGEGWVNTESIQTGQNIVYARLRTGLDNILSISESDPTQAAQVMVPDRVFLGLVPPSTIALNSHSAMDQGEVYAVTPDTILAFKDDASLCESCSHQAFNAAWNAVASHYEQFLTSNGQSRINALFDGRDFGACLWALGGVVLPSHICTQIDSSKYLTGQQSTAAIIFAPCLANRLAAASHRDVMSGKQVSEASISQPQLFADSRISQILSNIQISQGFNDGSLEFSFNSLSVSNEETGAFAGSTQSALATRAALGAGVVSRHDNFLLLSPENGVGAASGNAVVNEVANPAQAHVYYTTAKEIITRHYEGLVFNMSVEGDNSYTVNGAAVHNCMCRVEPVPLDSPEQITQNIRALMQFDPTIQPAPNSATDNFIDALLGPGLAALWRGGNL
jgi:hypothetical protein